MCGMLIPVLDDGRGLKIQAAVDIDTVACDTHEPRSKTPLPQCGMGG